MRMPRLDFIGARHHVMNRGARRQDVFLDDDSRRLFLDIIKEFPTRFGIRVHGYALMPNHYHLLLESASAELPRAMRHLGSEFTRQLNRLHRWDGPLFRGRYRNRIVGTDNYWQHLLIYVHLNPDRAGLTVTDAAAWTSHTAYLGQTERFQWLTTTELQAIFGTRETYQQMYDARRLGQVPALTEFDPKHLWAPHSTGTVAVPDASQPLWRVADALAQVCSVTGQTLEQLLTAPMGRQGNPANWLAAWWMSRHCGIAHGQIFAALGASHSTISKRIREIDRRKDSDPQLLAWVTALGKVERGNT